MRFGFTEDQQLLRDTVRDFLKGECSVAQVRELWETETGRSAALWSKLAEIGVPGLLVPEAQGGLGMDERDLVLLLEETGRAALAEPLISTAAVAAPLLRSLGEQPAAQRWLPALASGDAIVAVAHPVNAFVSDAHVAQLLLLWDGAALHGVAPSELQLTRQPANDPSRRIYQLDWTPEPATLLVDGPSGGELQADALDRGALACAAQLLGVTQQLVELSVGYANQRQQFGKAIGSFQAVKHMLADVQVRLEYARPLVYRAAHSVALAVPERSADVSMAKAAAGETALHAAKVALQVHGAIGYTWEQDLHVWMRRAWSLELAWGRSAWHRERLAAALLDGAAPVRSFGFRADGEDGAASGTLSASPSGGSST